jgi:hypothetical protein
MAGSERDLLGNPQRGWFRFQEADCSLSEAIAGGGADYFKKVAPIDLGQIRQVTHRPRLGLRNCPRNSMSSSPYTVATSKKLILGTVEREGVRPVSRKEMPMFTAERMKVTEMESFRQLARNEDWLADNFDKMIRSQDALSKDEPVEKWVDSEAVEQMEEHILQCLRAAVMMQWNTIPRKLQRELFDTAGSLGTYYKRSRSEARSLATYIVTRTKRPPQMAYPSLM